MLIIKSKGRKIDAMLKDLKRKVNQTGLLKDIRERQQFEKPSSKKRKEKLKAIYKEEKRIEEENK